MNWDQIEGRWKQVKGEAKRRWAQLTDDDLSAIGGQRDKLAGKLQERYGYAKDRANKEAHEFADGLRELRDAATEQAPRANRPERDLDEPDIERDNRSL
jgi:uncharacterized protein YjbJ (UPF0337 family)